MIKIKIKNSSIKEALFRYSKTASDKIYNNLLPYFLKGKEYETVIGIPLKEALYDKNAQTNGAPFLYYANAIGNEFSDVPQLKSNWDKKNKSFNQKYVSEILKKDFPITVKLSNEKTENNTFGHIFIHQQDSIKTIFEIVFYNRNYNNNQKIFQQAIKHELRHISQYINKLAIKYGEEIYLENDVSKMFPIPLRIQEEFLFTPIGTGKQITDIEKDTGGKKYVQGNIEFEPHMADIVEYTIDSLLSKYGSEILNNNIDSKELSDKYVNRIINNKIFAAIIFKNAGRIDLLNAIYQLNKIRPEEFSKKFKKNLKIEIDNARNVQ